MDAWQREGVGRDWEEKREGKLWPWCKINKLIYLFENKISSYRLYLGLFLTQTNHHKWLIINLT